MTFTFEGERLTVAQIRERVPALSRQTIRQRLDAGMTTRTEMLAVDPRQGYRRGGRTTSRRKVRT